MRTGLQPSGPHLGGGGTEAGSLLGGIKWVNLGGGHHITRADYQTDDLVAFVRRLSQTHGIQVYLEPGEAVALDAGILIGEVLDVFDNGMPIGITDISATCHMPDVIEAPYRPAMLGEPEDGVAVRLGGRPAWRATSSATTSLPNARSSERASPSWIRPIIRW